MLHHIIFIFLRNLETIWLDSQILETLYKKTKLHGVCLLNLDMIIITNGNS